MDAYRVIHHPGDEDEGARWACRSRQQRGPVEIASEPAPAVLRFQRTWLSASAGGEIFLFLPWLARLVGLPNGHVSADGSPGRTDDGRVVRDFKLEPTAREVASRKAVARAVYWFERGVFLVLTGMRRPGLGESCRKSIKDYAIFPPHQKKNMKLPCVVIIPTQNNKSTDPKRR